MYIKKKPQQLLISDPSMYQMSKLGSMILPGIYQSSQMVSVLYTVSPTDIF